MKIVYCTYENMNHTRTTESRSLAQAGLRCGYTFLILLFIPCFVWNIYAAHLFINHRNVETAYMKTTCHLLNYTTYQHHCVHCHSHQCTTDRCFDEKLSVTYLVDNNKTSISSVYTSFDKLRRHEQSQVQIIVHILSMTNVTTIYISDWSELCMFLPDDEQYSSYFRSSR